MANITVLTMGQNGVNVDKNPLELAPDELTQAQNAISDSASGRSTLRKRPGLIAFPTSDLAGVILGGIGVPFLNLGSVGTVAIYIGRGPTS